jgi:hypothetical protein
MIIGPPPKFYEIRDYLLEPDAVASGLVCVPEGCAFAMIESACLVQTKGSQRSFQPSMNPVIALTRSVTEPKVPRRMAWRVMIPKKISTMFNQTRWRG